MATLCMLKIKVAYFFMEHGAYIVQLQISYSVRVPKI